jgi:DNA helicase II / ATP-dependent DNA helicase PcrA
MALLSETDPQSASRLLDGLNPQQREAAAEGEGPVLVLAGAGSGKTRMLTHRIAHLIASGRARPHEILAVTFTNKAAKEMRERVEKLLVSEAHVWVSTFHSTCVRILRRDIGHLGYSRSFGIYDEQDSLAAIKRVLKALSLDERSYPPRAVRSQIDRYKNRGLMPADVGSDDRMDAPRMAEVYQRYQKELVQANALDFGDLLLLTVRLFEDHPGVLADYQKRWRYVLVDEYQDTNPVQYRLLRLLVAAHRNICVVGDEDQSIYKFREADIRNILDFEKDFPGARVFRLEQNYRSTQPILDAAIAVVSNNTERKGKRLFTERTGGEPVSFYEASDDRAEAAYVMNQILRARERGVPLADFAIFYRTHAQSRPFEDELLKYDLPYVVVGGTRFYDRAEIKNALGYLRALRNPDDTESLLRIINTPVRGIGRTTIERVLELASEHGISFHRALLRAREWSQVPSAAVRKIGEFLALMDELRAYAETGPGLASLLIRVLERSGYLRALEQEDSPESEARLENLRELVSASEEFERQNRDPTFAGNDGPTAIVDLFLESVTLIADVDDLRDDAGRIALLTAHVAKGLEFPYVFLVGMEEGLFPHYNSLQDPAALEEERRLCYVGMTRAKERLFLTNATLRRMFGTTRCNPPSRFLEEIPSELALGRTRRPRYEAMSPRAASRGDIEYERDVHVDEPIPRPSREPDRERGVHVDLSDGQWTPGELPPLRAGMRVEHPVFGRGAIVSIAGNGPSAKAQIRFDRAGMKTIVLRYAQLRILG